MNLNLLHNLMNMQKQSPDTTNMNSMFSPLSSMPNNGFFEMLSMLSNKNNLPQNNMLSSVFNMFGKNKDMPDMFNNLFNKQSDTPSFSNPHPDDLTKKNNNIEELMKNMQPNNMSWLINLLSNKKNSNDFSNFFNSESLQNNDIFSTLLQTMLTNKSQPHHQDSSNLKKTDIKRHGFAPIIDIANKEIIYLLTKSMSAS